MMAAPLDGMTAMAGDHVHSLSHSSHNASIPSTITSPTMSVVQVEVPAIDQASATTGSPSTAQSVSVANVPARVDFPPAIDTSDVGVQTRVHPALDIKPAMTSATSIELSPGVTSVASPSQDECLFLNKLPAEMRNEIYELAFTSNEDRDEVELCEAQPPSPALLFTCQQIRTEAAQLYEEGSYKYWTATHFSIETEDMHDEDSLDRLEVNLEVENSLRLQHKNVDLIMHIKVIGYCDIYGEANVYTYEQEAGIWRKDNRRLDQDMFLWFEPNRFRESGIFRGSPQMEEAATAAKRVKKSVRFHEELRLMLFHSTTSDLW
ncbi:hypothetical protein CKM354_000608000 [Cercospora kikuchii]|uniref:Uncharacterized protein n=1 Tax=Cercospora kikuchii TaxID=84275 RepID=A0A9P3FCZ2_9PEZI|nr:uncharacterized protein CKM354_000608000 [Cercospora kikuchii]GIZ42826.1 hypothetical protein CKM354_000608000 [Cercospora kikuchii]